MVTVVFMLLYFTFLSKSLSFVRVNPDSMEMYAFGNAFSKNQSLSLGSKNVFLLSEWTKCGKQMEIEFCKIGSVCTFKNL